MDLPVKHEKQYLSKNNIYQIIIQAWPGRGLPGAPSHGSRGAAPARRPERFPRTASGLSCNVVVTTLPVQD